MLGSAGGWWTSFDYVFNGKWTKDVNLYSLWAVLFLVAVTFFFVFLIRKGLKRMDSRLNFKAKTIARIVNSLISYIACIFLFFCILHIFGVNTTAMLASVSIISIAVGMGSQSVAADLLAGFFMMLDDTIHVGDYVSAGGVKGTVTDMGIRTTEITDDKGNVVILNNSKVGSVCNMSRNKEKQESENKTNEKE
jgi:small conductance mechanosensitive channel